MAKKILNLILIVTFLIPSFSAITFAVSKDFSLNELIELENSSKSNGMYIVNSESASERKYVTTKNAYISNASDVKQDDMSLVFNIDKEGSMRTFIRVYFPSLTSLGFYYRWDDSSWKQFTGEYSGDFAWIEIPEIYLHKGYHKFQICHKYANVGYDALYVTDDKHFVPEIPKGVIPMEKSETKKLNKQTKECIVSGNGAVFEVEDCTLKTGMTILGSDDASGNKAVKCTIKGTTTKPVAGAEGVIEFTFTAMETGRYNVWVRGLFETTGSRRWFTAIDNSSFSDINYPIVEGWSWTTIIQQVSLEAGQSATVRINPVHMNWSMDQFLVTSNNLYTPEGIVREVLIPENPILIPNTPLPPYNPVKGQHPRVHFTPDKIETIKSNINHPENTYAKEVFYKNVNANIKLPDSHDESILEKIESKALYYALYGDCEKGREAIDLTMEVGEAWYATKDNTGGVHDFYRLTGRQIYSASMVYDWCYPLLTDEEKNKIIETCIAWQTMSEIGWPPDKQLSMSGHGAEDQLLREMIAFAIATYDERPDIWDFVGGRFYTYYVPERLFLHQGGIHHQGTNYGIVRQKSDLYSYLLITGMGAPPPYDGEMLGRMSYGRQIYTRRPDGMVALSGDGYNTTPMTYALAYTYTTFMEYVISKDPYVKDEFVRSAVSATKDGFVTSFGVGVNLYLILNDVNVERESIYNLPNSKYFGTPNGIMVARTGWEEGVYSKDAVATIHFNEYYTGGHQHMDAGNFELYYKGPLVSDAGVYKRFGTEEHALYTRQTVAHNCILVHDPDEDLKNFTFVTQYVKNTGGQKNPFGSGGEHSFDTMMNNPEFRRATVTSQEIDPKNPITPEYTYIKGDLTNAYSDKVTDYKRSFMFFNLDDQNIPGALIVFDKLSVKNPEFKKQWLLHGQTYPEFDGNRTIWGSNSYVSALGEKYNGKMVVDSLLPKSYTTDVVGGEEDGWSNVNGVNYTGLDTSEFREENTYRLEITPSENTETTYFLNCLQVTDNGNLKYLDSELIESEELYGVKISNRIVMFSKSGEKLSKDLTLDIKGEGIYKYTICDLEKGQWEVSVNGSKNVYTVTEEGSVLSFEENVGNITVKRISQEYEEKYEEIILKDSPVYYVKYTNRLIGFSVEPELVGGKLMVPVSDLLTKMEIKQGKEFLSYKFTDEKQKIEVLVQPDTNVLVKNGEVIETVNKSYIKDGKLMVELRAFSEAFNFKVFWDEYEQIAAIYPQKVVVSEELAGYAKIIDIKDDGGQVDPAYTAPQMADGLLTTNWAAEGIGRYIDFELSEETILENVEIAFNPGAQRTPSFEIAISSDGENYTTIYEGKGDPNTDGNYYEVFTFDKYKTFKTKYVRYIANGSDKSKWNGVREIRFKIGEEMENWEKGGCEIYTVAGDGKEVDNDYANSNLYDLNSRTYWKAFGKDRFITFELKEKQTVSGIEIVFVSEKDRTQKFDILVSSDGVEFKKVFEGMGKANPDLHEWEKFTFTPCENVKFVRYVGKGNNFDRYNEVNEIRILSN